MFVTTSVRHLESKDDMILITGGRGAVATRLLPLLLERGEQVRLASADPSELDPPDGVTPVRLNLTEPATFPAALSGIDSVFLYARPDHIGEFADQAVAAGVAHIVLLSSVAALGPDPGNSIVAKAHYDVEQALLASPIPATILRPGAFAANAKAWAANLKSGRPVSLPYPGVYTDPIHEEDLAEAAFAALTDPRHLGGQFTLTGPETLTFTEQIEQLAEVTGRPLTIAHVSPEEWKQEMAEYIPARFADGLLAYWKANDGKPVELTQAVKELTGRPARTFATWVADHLGDYTS